MKLMKQRGLIPLAVIFIVIIVTLAVAAYLKTNKNIKQFAPEVSTLTPSPVPTPDIKLDETGKSKIYTNHVENYSLKFPLGWVLSEKFQKTGYEDPRIETPISTEVILFPPSEQNKEAYKTHVGVIVRKPNPRANSADVEKIAANFEKEYSKPISDGAGQREYKIANLTVDGRKAIRRVSRTLPGDQTERFYSLETGFPYGVFIYDIDFSGDETIINDNLKIYEQIITSFKLSSSEPTFSPTSLKTYTNEAGYSFQYPGNWLVNSFQGDYSKGIIIVDEKDQEVFALHKEARNGKCLPSSYYGKDYVYPSREVQLGDTKVILFSDCDHPRVVSSKGQEFKMDPDIFVDKNIKPVDPRLLDLLKSIQGLKVVL